MVHRFPSYPEGRLSKLKAHLVSAAHLYEVAQKLDLGRFSSSARGEEMSGGRAKRTLLVDCLEALIRRGLPRRRYRSDRQFVNRWVIGDTAHRSLHVEAEIMGAPIVDFKSALQELAQARKLPQAALRDRQGDTVRSTPRRSPWKCASPRVGLARPRAF